MSDVNEESLLDYFSSSGGSSGRVKNADILRTFKAFIGHADPQLRAKYREEFKLIIDRIAVVKSENGEKYLVLKKKYRQQLQEKEAKHPRMDGEGQRHPSPAKAAAAAVQWDAGAGPNRYLQQDEPMSCAAAEVHTENAAPHRAAVPLQEASAPSSREEELDQDSGSKSESEQDEEGTGSVGSAAVALDPIEKEWIYSAAGARVPDLSQLLRQDVSLANKKSRLSFTALHWAAKHGSEDMATLLANAGADVNSKSVSGYTPLHIAALHGHRHIQELLTETYGAKENLRDYSGRLASHYLKIKEPEGPEDETDLSAFQVTQARERHRNRKLASLFQSKKKWGSAEDLAPIEEERSSAQQQQQQQQQQHLALPAFRPRKFSR
ncbi:ankyrin repeat domain-containing protein SOWAHC [Nelusetta ayraudi]|uniref:ankyrin repeat domain-containing protein SOWAHC n=1 Tax=Nelusetta ayraudi TaxID=303726 RepID=UPI003F6EFECB